MIDPWYYRTLAQCDKALARQAAIMQRLSPDTPAYSAAVSTMTALEHTKTLVVMGQKRRTTAAIRRLRFDLLKQYRMRGQIIANAARCIAHDGLLDLLEARGDDLDETWQCLILYRNWVDFCKATRWNTAIGNLPPDNLDDALRMLSRWKRRRLH